MLINHLVKVTKIQPSSLKSDCSKFDFLKNIKGLCNTLISHDFFHVTTEEKNTRIKVLQQSTSITHKTIYSK